MAKESIASNPEKVKPAFEPSVERRAEYERTYYRLMFRAKDRVYVRGEHERHHIKPKSLGGTNEIENLVCLTFKEHFLAHWLLFKFTFGEDRRKMACAFHMMLRYCTNHSGRKLRSWQYSQARKARSFFSVGNTYAKGNPSNTGKIFTAERRERIRLKALNRVNRFKSVRCLNDGREFKSGAEAARFYGVHQTMVSSVCLGKRNHTHGYKFEFI